MIIDITTGFFPCTGRKPGRPGPCMADSEAGACAYVSSIWTQMKGTVGQLALLPAWEQTVAEGGC